MNAVSYLDVGWHPGTVLLSVLVATFASYVSLELSRRVRDLDGAVAHAWWLAGSLTMGTGVWSMHFVGMLAFDAPLALGYRHDLTALSWLAALVAAGTVPAAARVAGAGASAGAGPLGAGDGRGDLRYALHRDGRRAAARGRGLPEC